MRLKTHPAHPDCDGESSTEVRHRLGNHRGAEARQALPTTQGLRLAQGAPAEMWPGCSRVRGILPNPALEVNAESESPRPRPPDRPSIRGQRTRLDTLTPSALGSHTHLHATTVPP